MELKLYTFFPMKNEFPFS